MATSVPQTSNNLGNQTPQMPAASDFALFKSKLENLMRVYLNIMDSIANERLVRIGNKRAEVKNAPARNSNLLAKLFRPYVKIFRSMKDGELPFAAIVLRYLENLFVSYHIKARINKISDYLQFEELKNGLSTPLDKATTVEFKIIAKNLSKLENMLSSGVKLKILLVISPIIPVVTWALDFFSVKVNLPALSSLDLSGHKHRLMLLGGLTLFYVLFIVSSSFIAKRQIMLANNVYELERELFGVMKRRRPRELPWDIIGWTILVALYGLTYMEGLRGTKFGGWLEIQNKLIILMVVSVIISYLSGFFYALVKRIRLQQW